MRKAAISKPVNLLYQQWVMVYENNDRTYQIADNIYKDLQKASQQLKLRVEEPHWIELTKENNKEELDEKLRQYMMGDKQFRHPTMVICVL